MPRSAVVGAGPAGLMAAEVLATAGHAVTLYDRMPSPARKLLLAGRGGLNLTHSEPLDRFLTRYADSPVAGFVRAFPPQALRDWAAALGQPTFVGSSGRVFPQAFKSTPLLRAWLARLREQGVLFRFRHRWTGWDGPALAFDTPDGPARDRPDTAILALGGASWPRLGSDGTWAAPLQAAGIPVSPLRAANAGVRIAWPEPFRTRFAGTPLKRIALTCGPATVRGEAMVTADGLEGGVIYALGRTIREQLDQAGTALLHLDLRPDLDPATLARRLGGRGISMANALRRAGLPPVTASLVRDGDATVPLATRIKDLPLPVTGLQGLARAISTAGGVPFSALDGLMLRSRPGTFLAGEMLDWEAPTGGYLLQACFATGWAAAHQALGTGLACAADNPLTTP